MRKNKANGPAECLVTEMLQWLPTETVYEVAHWFEKRFRGECQALEAWTILRLVFLKNLDAKLEKGTTWLPCNHPSKRIFKMVHNGAGGSVA